MSSERESLEEGVGRQVDVEHLRTVRGRALMTTTVGVFVALVVGLVVALRYASSEARAHRAADRALHRVQLEAVSAAIRDGDSRAGRERLEAVPARLRGWEWNHLAGRVGESHRVLRQASDDQRVPLYGTELAFDSNGERLTLLVCRGETDRNGVMRTSIETLEFGSGRVLESDTVVGLGRLATSTERALVTRKELSIHAVPDGARLRDFGLPEILPGDRFNAAADGELVFIKTPRMFLRVRTDTGRVDRFASPGFGFDLRLRSEIGLGTHSTPGGFALFELDDPTRFWKVKDGQYGQFAAELSPDGRYVAHPQPGGRVALWETRESAAPVRIATLGDTSDQLVTACFSSDSRLVATGGYGRAVRVFSTSPVELLESFSGHEAGVTSLAFSPDGRWLASCGRDLEVRLFDLQRRDPRAVAIDRYVYVARFTRDGKSILIGTLDGRLQLHDARTLIPYASLPLWTVERGAEPPRDLELSPDGRHAVVGSPRGEMAIVDLERGEVHAADELRGMTATYSPEGETLLSIAGELSAVTWDDRRLELRDAETLEVLRSTELPNVRQPYVRTSSDGRWIAVTGPRLSARILDAESLKAVGFIEGHASILWRLAFSPSNRILATASGDDTVGLFEVPSGQPIDVLRGHARAVYALAFSEDGSRLYTGSKDASIKVWDMQRREEIATLLGHDDYVYSIDVHPNGEALVSASGDGTVRLWDTRTTEALTRDQDAYRAAASRLEPLALELAGLSLEDRRARLNSDATLDEREREIALQLALGRSIRER